MDGLKEIFYVIFVSFRFTQPLRMNVLRKPI